MGVLEFGVWGLWSFWVWGLGVLGVFGVWGLGFRGFGGLGFRVEGLGFGAKNGYPALLPQALPSVNLLFVVTAVRTSRMIPTPTATWEDQSHFSLVGACRGSGYIVIVSRNNYDEDNCYDYCYSSCHY